MNVKVDREYAVVLGIMHAWFASQYKLHVELAFIVMRYSVCLACTCTKSDIVAFFSPVTST